MNFISFIRFLVAIVLVFSASAHAQDADKCAPTDHSNSFGGKTDDNATGIAFNWVSSAVAVKRENNDWWSIRNALCNIGQVPLVITWAKANIQANAVSPLLPGGQLLNVYTVGPLQPEPDSDSPIIYGLNARSASAQTYQQKRSAMKLGVLNSTIQGRVGISDWAKATSKPEATNIEMHFQSEPTKDGYIFSYSPKSSATSEMSIGIVSNQTTVLVEALTKSGVPFKIGKPSDFTKTGIPGEIDFGNSAMVFIAAKGNSLRLTIPTQASDVEIAKVVLIKDAVPIASGNISLFHQ